MTLVTKCFVPSILAGQFYECICCVVSSCCVVFMNTWSMTMLSPSNVTKTSESHFKDGIRFSDIKPWGKINHSLCLNVATGNKANQNIHRCYDIHFTYHLKLYIIIGTKFRGLNAGLYLTTFNVFTQTQTIKVNRNDFFCSPFFFKWLTPETN